MALLEGQYSKLEKFDAAMQKAEKLKQYVSGGTIFLTINFLNFYPHNKKKFRLIKSKQKQTHKIILSFLVYHVLFVRV